MNNMECKFQCEGTWEVVEIVAKMWPAILTERLVWSKVIQEKKRKIYVHSEGGGGEGRNLF